MNDILINIISAVVTTVLLPLITFAQAVFFYAQKSKGNLVKHISAKLTCIPLVVRLECVGML